jgi:hypothetical protein
VTVTFKTTAVIPLAGTPFVPVTWRLTLAPAPTGRLATPVPQRVSMIRVGPALVNDEPPAE